MTPTPYAAIIPNTFTRTYKKLPDATKQRIRKAIEDILRDPHRGTPLTGELQGQHRWRVGDHRIRYTIDDEAKTVTLLHVGPRRSIYN